MLVQRVFPFLAVVVGTIVASLSLAYAQDKRQVWEYADRFFRDQGKKVWVETDRHGAILHKFLERDRTGKFVQLYDSSRGYTIRLYDTSLHIKGGDRPGLRKFHDWTKLHDGKWVSAPQPSPTSINRDVEPPPFITVMPVFFVPKGEKQPTEDQISRFMKHLQIAQSWYKDALGNRDTFTLAKDVPEIIQGKHPISYYKMPREKLVSSWEVETLDRFKVNRYNCPYIFACIIMNAKGDWPIKPGGVPLNGGINRGGGLVSMHDAVLDKYKSFQGVIIHELGHSFGLVHATCYGYDDKTNRSIMAHSALEWSGFKPPTKPSILIPEDIRVLSENHRVFPKLVFDPSHDVPTGYAMGRWTVLFTPEFPGVPSYEESIDKRRETLRSYKSEQPGSFPGRTQPLRVAPVLPESFRGGSFD